MKKYLLLAALCVLPLCLGAQDKAERLDSVVVSASRAGKNTPVTYDNLGRDALGKANPQASLPMALELLPSVVTYNEGGTGLGNSAMTIRGSKGSQINVTLNGITLNDAESQEVFWVNIPALTSLLSSVQVQRGLGTTANGAGAFGASINMNTAFVAPKPWVKFNVSAGSFNTFVTTGAASSGLLKNGLYASAAYSNGFTDGYIRNAFVRSQSAFVVLGWLRGRNSLRITWLMGAQRSGITWDGITLEQYAIDRTYNGAGKYKDDAGNVFYYPNQTDNYTQHHFQLNYTHAFSGALAWTTTLNFTPGSGYDEYYKTNKELADYGFQGLPAATPAQSDIIYRKESRARLWVLNSDLRFRSTALDVTAGVNVSHYHGGHWGRVLWIKALGDGYDTSGADWYRNDGLKMEASAFVRAEYKPLAWLTAYADLQYRGVHYDLYGRDDDWWSYGAKPADKLAYRHFWSFFNPRAGVTAVSGLHKAYLSLAWGYREPGRGDIKENVKGSTPNPIEPEKMLDLEVGYSYTGEHVSMSTNLYLMEYFDMLLESGRLSSSGYAIKENVPRAWRRGVEWAAAWSPWSWIKADVNLTLSLNQIADYTSYVKYDDYSGRVHPVHYGQTTMLLSPGITGMARLTINPLKGASLAFSAKYVGKQYLDNTMREDLVVPAYLVAGFQAGYSFSTGISINVYVNNLFNKMYYAHGYRWESYNEAADRIDYGIGVYPQAPLNAMVKVAYEF
ncbi:MAG: TonB-dependent receptor [Bacteroidales bacterium]|nr:TonB-dependent receptor [Bacteroidales bacterium]